MFVIKSILEVHIFGDERSVDLGLSFGVRNAAMDRDVLNFRNCEFTIRATSIGNYREG